MIKPHCRILFLLSVLSLSVACAQENSIFPTVNTSLSEDEIVLANPISLAVNEAASQLYVVNSNVDFFASEATLAVFDVDATDPETPVLTATQVLAIPNFAGQAYFDGVDDLFIPFRESSSSDSERDTFRRFRLTSGEFAQADSTTIADDPFGLSFANGQFYIVSEKTLSVFATNLDLVTEMDLTTARTAGIDDAGATYVESVGINADATKALVSNRGDNLFVVDLTDEEIVQVVDGPISTRDVLVDANDASRVFVIDSNSEAILVFDFDLLPEPTTIPETIDASEFLVTSIGVGQDPNGLLMDATDNRLYVCNSFDDTISVIDTLSLQEIARISLNGNDLPASFTRDVQDPVALNIGTFAGEKYLFVAGITSNSIAVIRTGNLAVALIYPDNDLNFSEDPRDDDE